MLVSNRITHHDDPLSPVTRAYEISPSFPTGSRRVALCCCTLHGLLIDRNTQNYRAPRVTLTALFRSRVMMPSSSISITSNSRVFLYFNWKCEQNAAAEMRLYVPPLPWCLMTNALRLRGSTGFRPMMRRLPSYSISTAVGRLSASYAFPFR